MLLKNILARLAVAAACLSVFVAAWYGVIGLLDLQPFILPTPRDVAIAIGQQYPMLASNMAITLKTGLLGIVISTALAFLTAAVFSSNKGLAQVFMPYLIAMKNTPIVAIAPIVMLFLGRGVMTGIAVVTIVSFLPMMVNCLQGFQAVGSRHLELLHMYAARPAQVFWKVRFPFAVQYVFAGLRTAVPAAVLGALLAEWLTGAKGIGSFILEASAMRDLEILWGAIIVCMGTSMAIFWLTVLAERFYERRHPSR